MEGGMQSRREVMLAIPGVVAGGVECGAKVQSV